MVKIAFRDSRLRNTALLIIDAQMRIINPIENKEYILKNIKKLLKSYNILEKNIFFSEQNPHKLGGTINNLIPSEGFEIITKMDFSLANNKILLNHLNKGRINKLIICGFETHICIQQSVLDFLNLNFEVFIVADAMASRNKFDHEIALQRMCSKGASITSTESIIFELCKTSSRKEFKEISNIIKNK